MSRDTIISTCSILQESVFSFRSWRHEQCFWSWDEHLLPHTESIQRAHAAHHYFTCTLGKQKLLLFDDGRAMARCIVYTDYVRNHICMKLIRTRFDAFPNAAVFHWNQCITFQSWLNLPPFVWRILNGRWSDKTSDDEMATEVLNYVVWLAVAHCSSCTAMLLAFASEMGISLCNHDR